MNWPKGVDTPKQKAAFVQAHRVKMGWTPPAHAELKQWLICIALLVVLVAVIVFGVWLNTHTGCADIGGWQALCR